MEPAEPVRVKADFDLRNALLNAACVALLGFWANAKLEALKREGQQELEVLKREGQQELEFLKSKLGSDAEIQRRKMNAVDAAQREAGKLFSHYTIYIATIQHEEQDITQWRIQHGLLVDQFILTTNENAPYYSKRHADALQMVSNTHTALWKTESNDKLQYYNDFLIHLADLANASSLNEIQKEPDEQTKDLIEEITILTKDIAEAVNIDRIEWLHATIERHEEFHSQQAASPSSDSR